ncbi:ABC transporter permease [Portibacter marinus]|uniref:ABC transporter permease n=1 Tax=Portibacter marinus TaxID=2898660 RepID=UPI001F2BA93D|nr:ABC transporter permease [Portibacter marinus]
MRGRKIAIWVIIGYLAIALFHPFIANDKPIVCKINERLYYPIFDDQPIDLSASEWKVMALIPYSASTIDTKASFQPPFKSNHILGTDILGRDTLAGIFKGTEIAVKIGFISVFLATFLALIIGLSVSYLKRFPIRLSRIQFVIIILSFLFLVYYSWISMFKGFLFFMVPLLGLLMVNGILAWLIPHKWKTMNLPIDVFYLRLVEAMKAIPGLIFVLMCVSLFNEFSVSGLTLILAFLMWPSISRFIRAESMKILVQDYITAARAYGASGFRILLRHVLPKLFTSLSVIIAFSISSAIIIESTLSFIGLGVPIEQVSWGSLLKEAQRNISAWWLAVFPGLALFILILCLNIVGEKKVVD